MKKLFLILIAPFALAVSLIALAGFKGVVPIDHEDGAHFCTSWSINQKARLYVTALHCVKEDPTHIPHMFSQRTRTKWESEDHDLAVIEGPVGVRALKVAPYGPRVGDAVTVVGFPIGMEKSVTFGHIMNLHQPVENDEVKTTFAVPGAAPGNSGSPIMNVDGEVVSVLQVGWMGLGIVGGTPWEVMARALAPFKEGAK